MRRISRDAQRELLTSLADLGYGQAEAETDEVFARRFLPIPEHLRALDPGVVLVVGERGAGKSALFKAIFRSNLVSFLSPYAEHVRLPPLEPGRVEWVQAYPLGSGFPDGLGLKRFFAERGEDLESSVRLWFAYLVRQMKPYLDPVDGQLLAALLEPMGADASAILAGFDQAGDRPLLALDRLDRRLEDESRWIFVGYDELDTLGGVDWTVMRASLQGLIAYWAQYSRRWKRLRAKIFLRRDLFRRHAGVGGADLPKLAANRAELSWSNRNLFAVLIKRIANTSDDLRRYCEGATIRFRASDPQSELGYIPNLETSDAAKPLITRLVGEYMGANRQKGATFTWVLDHLRDGNGSATPRSLVRLIEQAAQKEQNNPLAESPHLIHPSSIRRALEDVSIEHVLQASTSEWPWLVGVKERLRIASVTLIPWNARDLRKAIEADWQGDWGGSGTAARPPAADAGELIEYLKELGVVRERSDGRLDAPDLYLYGLGLRRRGGVKRG